MDEDRLNRLLTEIEDLNKKAEDLLSIPLENFLRDFKAIYALKMILVEMTEIILSIGLLILREGFKIREIEGYVWILRELVKRGVLSNEIGENLEALVRLRNMIIHRYWEVDERRLYRESKESIGLIKKFIEEVKNYASKD
ncbi:MAG: hypothetical protein DRO00_04380 [Thermoproteota archaeon]|nr:MAG: hypothetical protein DRO00_04380 [Candidatus Korarchaeota archaeon]